MSATDRKRVADAFMDDLIAWLEEQERFAYTLVYMLESGCKPCPLCHTSGWQDDDQQVECPRCGGDGKV